MYIKIEGSKSGASNITEWVSDKLYAVVIKKGKRPTQIVLRKAESEELVIPVVLLYTLSGATPWLSPQFWYLIN